MIDDWYQFSVYYVFPIVLCALYLLYYRKFAFFKIVQDFDPKNIRNKLARGKCPPSYPNGWYVLSRSNLIKQGQVMEIKLCGRHIVYYRGEDNVVYAVSSYCTHMGANLGYGGKVKNKTCIECPFHGWIFDGKTGVCVNSDQMDPKIITKYKYIDIDQMAKNQQGNYIVPEGSGESKLKPYIVKELNGLVYIWIHVKEPKPYYDPVQVQLKNLTLRAESINYVNCHIQEIPENGADQRHFDYVHSTVVDGMPFLRFQWTMKTKRPVDPDFKQVMTHWNPKIRAYQNDLFEQFLSDKNRLKYMNVLSLDAYLILFNKWKFYVLTATGFQVGPATVSLYVKGLFFESLFQQYIQPIEKFTLKVYHTVFTQGFLPYFASAYILHGELRQVLFDNVIWEQKIFSEKLHYNMKGDSDKTLLDWRQWYCQFYEGCHEFEGQQTGLEW